MKEIIQKIQQLRQNNICTCDRRICHCGKFPTAKEGDAYNIGLEEAINIIQKHEQKLS